LFINKKALQKKTAGEIWRLFFNAEDFGGYGLEERHSMNLTKTSQRHPPSIL
jgi:hypothetical protein